MGWSCNAAASFTLDAIKDAQTAMGCTSSNGIMLNGEQVGFWETGRENEDGAITGTVWAMVSEDRCNRVGSFRIEPNGEVTRFPRVSRRVQIMCQEAGAKRFRETYGSIQAEREGIKLV